MMFKEVGVSILAVLLIGSSALGGVLQQDQIASIGTSNTVHLAQGQQNSLWAQDLVIDLTQSGDGESGLMVANVYAFGSSHEFGGWGVSGLLAATAVGVTPGLRTSGLLLPTVGGSVNAVLARARLNSLLLTAN
jgi:hypothetical protein